jgi:3',5'-cyclic AMP phosphodiesterase CpdA
VPTSALHISDLHAGKHETPGLVDGLSALVAETAPELVLATGDLAHRGRRDQLELARTLLDSLGPPVLAVPGNHDLPYSFPARFARPEAEFVQVFGTAEPTFRSDALVVCGLNSTWPWRHQGGHLAESRLARAAETLSDPPPGALRVVAFHHHLAGAPWRTSRKFPLKHRDRVLRLLVEAGAELVVGGHIHQSTTVERHEIEALDGTHRGSVVLATAPGLGRPRPHRLGEAQGVHVYEWDADTLTVSTRVWDGSSFVPTATRAFPRRD